MKINSFRDPDGNIYITDRNVLRVVMGKGVCLFQEEFLNGFGHKLVAEQRLINTEILDQRQANNLLEQDYEFRNQFTNISFEQGKTLIFEHEKIPFISYCYEWPAEMLYAVGLLIIDIAIEASQFDLGLKDATPYNVLFKGANPIMVDVLSFEKREQGDYKWLAYAQFIRMFLLPLLVNKYFCISISDLLIHHRDGLEPDNVYNLCSFSQKLLPPFLTAVSLPKWLANGNWDKNGNIYQKKLMPNLDKAKFIYQTLLNNLRNSLKKLAPINNQKSVWSDYVKSNNNYSPEQLLFKCEFIKQFLSKFNPQRVLDVGCNIGDFSFLAARHGASVVAIDYDPIVVGIVWKKAYEEKLDILPLHVNITRPTPSMGWRNMECLSFLERTQGYFDTVFMLAIVHHLLVSERIPLKEIIDLAAELTTKYLVVEYVDPEDSMFKRLTRGCEELYNYLTSDVFEEACSQQFDIVTSKPILGSRRSLYILCKRGTK